MSSEYNSLNLSLNFGMMNLMHVYLIYTEFYGDIYLSLVVAKCDDKQKQSN